MQAIRLQQTIEKDGEIHLSDLKVIAKSIDALNRVQLKVKVQLNKKWKKD